MYIVSQENVENCESVKLVDCCKILLWCMRTHPETYICDEGRRVGISNECPEECLSENQH